MFSMRGLLCFTLVFSPLVLAQPGTGPLRGDHLTVQLVADRTAVAPGETLGVALRVEHDPEWHTYWRNPGDSGLPTKLVWTLPEGASAGPIRWPVPKRLPLGPLVNFGYEGELLPPQLTVGGQFALALKANWLVCKEECIPGSANFELSLPVAAQSVSDPQWALRIDAAFAAEPPPREWPAQFTRAGDVIDIAIGGADADIAAQSIEVFPIQTQVLANARGSAVRDADGRLRVSTPISDAFNGLPQTLEFVLVAGEGATHRAYTLVAEAASGASAASTVPADRSAAGGAGAAPLGMLLALVFALLGGIALNLMPCVFPVLSLKAMGLAEGAGDPARSRRHGLLYLAGVLATFVGLASLLLGLRAAGEQLGWGFQLQVPWVVATLALVMLAMGLSLSGLFQIGGAWMGAGQSLASGHDGRSAFFTGVLAVVVASPCTAPFMGPALGYAVTQSPLGAILVFAALGVGLALPIVLISFVPALANRLPRPGAWMEGFKQFMAFPLYLTAVWLLWVLGQQTGVDGIAILLLGAVALAFALWLLGRAGGFVRRGLIGASLVATVVAVVSLQGMSAVDGQAARSAATPWEPWSPERLAELRAEGRPVLVNMTAAWCITCLANERVALSSEAFHKRLAESGIAYLKGDWTQRDERITRYLAQFGRNGVPVYALYPAGGGEPELLPQILTPDGVDAALTRAARL
jgi:thiol:disulfide interchange protein